MSSEDQVRPYHAKDEARGQEAADAVAAVLQHAAEQEELAKKKPAPKKQPKWMLPLGIQLAVIAMYLLISQPGWINMHPIEGPDRETLEEGLREAMFVQSQQIEAYRQDTGRLPSSLDELPGSPQPGVEYQLQGTQEYSLVGTNGEAALIYESTEPAQDFLGATGADKLGAGGRPASAGE